MANATGNLPLRTSGETKQLVGLLASNVHLYQGGMRTQLTASGYVVPATTASAGAVIGVSPNEVSAELTAAGGTRVMLEQGIFRFANDATAPIPESTQIGVLIFAADDQSVALTGTTYAGTYQGHSPTA